MRASEKMAQRVVLVRRLQAVDDDLVETVAKPASNRVTATARRLLSARQAIADELIAVGYEPWSNPIDIREAKVS